MALPYGQLEGWTRRYVVEDVENNWFLDCPLLWDIVDAAKKAGGLLTGGKEINYPIVYRPENAGNITPFIGNTPLNCDPNDIGTVAKYLFRFVAILRSPQTAR